MYLKDAKKTLQCFDALLAYGNFTKAAHALYISQPYLTQFIQKLERELHVQLISRMPNHLQLTEAGKTYYNYLETLENDTAQFSEKLQQYQTKTTDTTLQIGILSTLGSYLLPRFIPQFLEAHQHVKLLINEDQPRHSEAKLLAHKLDFYIGQNPETLSSNLVAHACGNRHYFAVIPAQSTLYDSKQTLLAPGTISMKALLSEPLLLTANGSAIRRQVDYLLQKYQIQPNILVESDNIFTIYQLSQKGSGVTIVPEELVQQPITNTGYNLYPLSDRLISIKFFIAHHADKTLTPLEQALITTFEQALALKKTPSQRCLFLAD